jgi:ferric-dicitrate binding protein FerR (iron transport regulator)
MPMPWKTILSNVPWSDVIGKAPIIADGARKLWKNIGRKADDGSATDSSGDLMAADDADFSGRLAALEAAQRELRSQLLASGELIQALGEQNAQLVAQLDAQRRLVRRQSWALAATAVAAGLALIAWLPRLSEFLA